MAEEVKKIITVEVGKSITSVRDFKKHLDDLRGSLLGLNEESEEYKTIAEQIATDQAKLNDVMKIGKTNTDAAAGSYVDLNNQLKALRNQYKALSETERNSATGQGILENINKLDTELKDIDASMGQYQRNVGNYKSAFEGAFQMITSEVSKINPTLGALLSAVQNLIPAFNGVGTAAKGAGRSIKSALVSTGVGVLLVVLGEIISHWDTISEKIRNVLGLQDNYIRSLERTRDQIKEIKNDLNDIDFSFLDSASNAAGFNTLQRFQTHFDALESSMKTIIELDENIKGGLITIQDTRTAMYSGAAGTYEYNLRMLQNLLQNYEEVAGEEIQLSREEKQIIKDLKKDLSDAIAVANDYTYVSQDMGERTLNVVGEFLQKELEENQRRFDKLEDQWKEQEQKRGEAIEVERLGYEKRAEDAENFYMTEEQLLKKELEAEKAYVISITKEGERRNTMLAGLEKEYQAKIKKARETAWKSSDAYKEREERIADAKNLYKSLENYGKDEVKLVMDKYEKELDLLTQFGYDTTNLTNKYLDDVQQAIMKKSDDIEAVMEQIAEEIRSTWEKEFNDSLLKIEDEETAALHGADMTWTIDPKTHESDINLEREKEDKIYEIRKEGYQKRINLYQEHLLFLEAGSEEYLDLERQITEAKMDLDDLGYQHAVDLEERKRQDIQLTIDKVNEAVRIAQGSIQFYGGIANEIAAYTLETAKEGTAEYKAAQITQTIVSTLSGMVGSFSQAMSLYGPTPWGFALGAAGATAMGIIGALRVNQIKNANGNSSIGSSSAGASAPGVAVEPLLNPDYDLQRITNLSLQGASYAPGNTQVYVLESDIQEVGNRVQVRENNATF